MPRRLRILVSLALICSTGAAAPPAVPIVERIEVRLSQLDVVVRDKAGKFVSGLSSSDFEAFEDGSPLEIVAADEWGLPRPTPAPPAAPGLAQPGPSPTHIDPGAAPSEQRSFVLVFDALGDSTALRMNQAKNAAASFVRAQLRSDDLAAVYQLDLSLRALSGVSSNVDEIATAINKVSWMGASSLQDQIAESVLSYGSPGANPLMQERLAALSTNQAQQLDWQREHVYASLNNLAALFGALPGRRMLVLVSPGFPLTTAGDQKTGAGGFTPRFRELIRSLATYGVTVYSLDIGNDLAAGDASEKIDWRIAVGKLGMDENTLSDLGLERSMGTSSASSRREFLGVIAAETGGRLLTQTDLNKAFDVIREESDHFYRVSCRVPVTAAAHRYRKLVVKVKRPGSVVTSRRGRYSDITPQDRAPLNKSGQVESLERYTPLTARGVAFPLPAVDPKKVPVAVVVEALGPVQLAIDAQGGAALDVEFRLVARVEGEIVDRYERSFTARVKPAGVPALRNAFRVEGRLSLVPGIYEVQASVRLGAPPQLASWSATISVPPPGGESHPAVTGAILSVVDGAESPLLSRPQVPDDFDSLAPKAGFRVLPSTQPDFEAGSNLLVLFWLRGFRGAEGTPPELDLSLRVAAKDGKEMALPATILFFGKEPTGGYRAVARIDAATLAPGEYVLLLSAGVAGPPAATASRRVPFLLRALSAPELRTPPTTSSSAESP